MTAPFASPAPATSPEYTGDKLKLPEVVGSLVMIDVAAFEAQKQTVNGTKDGIRCDITIVDGHRRGEVHRDQLLFQMSVVPQLKGAVGQRVLCRIGYGAKMASGNSALVLNAATAADIALGQAFLANPQAVAAGAPPF